MNNDSHPPRDDEAHPPDDRLESWKRIAAYLNRDVRTLRRWERNEGLPVHRQMHDRQATVYAYKSELDAWRESRTHEGGGQAQAPRRALPLPSRGLLVLSALLVGAAGLWWWQSRSPELPFAERDWVLITRFDNRTGEDIFNGTLEYALERALSNSRFVNVVPRERITDALRLMKLPEDTVVDADIGREIALRDGGIRALITGRIENFGGNYLLGASLLNPVNGVSEASFDANAPGQEAILPAVSRVSDDVRKALGESLSSIRASDEPLAKVTTPSLEALRFYSEADRMMGQGWPHRYRALPLLERAVGIDPDFASAHLLLYYLYTDRDQLDLANIHLERAVELAETTTERERLFILSTYYTHYLGDFEKANETNALLVQLYPDHVWATGNLANAHEALGQYEQAHPYWLKLASMRPNLSWVNLTAVQSSVAFDDPEGFARFADRARELAREDVWMAAQLRVLPVQETWLDGDLERASQLLDEIVAQFTPDELVANGPLFDAVRSMYLALGQRDTFEKLSALRPEVGWFQALLDLDSGDPGTLDDYLDNPLSTDYFTVTLFAWADRTEEARELVSRIVTGSAPWFLPALKYVAQAQLAIAEDRPQEALDYFEQSFQFLPAYYLPHYLFGAGSLARLHESLGSSQAAIETLEFARLRRDWSIFEPGGTFLWMRNQVYLRELYLKAGRMADAERVSDELRGLLRLADPDFPTLLSLD
jgi:tetratricopeptide (TPR) repeat protein